MTQSRTAIFELVFAGLLWGFGFIAATWALETMGPLTITGLRFTIAAGVGYAITLTLPRLRRTLTWAQFRMAMVPGLLLSTLLVLQTYGLELTTATKSGFITTLYVLIVPLMERIWMKRRLPRYHLLFVIAALVGVALICDMPGALLGREESLDLATAARQRWNFGDVLTLLCAIAASLHILWFGRIHAKITSSFVFNLHQAMWAGALPLMLAFVLEAPPTSLPSILRASIGHPLIGLLMLGLGSTLIAFALQIRAQKKISPSLASLLFLLESPFAALFAVNLLGDHLQTDQWLGAALIMTAVVASTTFETQ